MTDDELAEMEQQLAAKMSQIAELQDEATEMLERIMAERERRRASATVHELRR